MGFVEVSVHYMQITYPTLSNLIVFIYLLLIVLLLHAPGSLLRISEVILVNSVYNALYSKRNFIYIYSKKVY